MRDKQSYTSVLQTPPQKKELEHDKSSETHLPYSSPEAHRKPGQPYDYVSDNICWKKQGWVEQG